MSENEQIIELISRQTKILLSNHWTDITDFRNGGESIKVGFSHDIGYEGQERIVESTISFGKRVKDSTVERLDTDQMNLNLAAKAPAVNMPAPGKRRGRPPKNVLEASLKRGPMPETQPGSAA